MASRGPHSYLHVALAILGIAALLGSGFQLATREDRRAQAAPPGPRVALEAGYTSSQTCRACHPGPYASWADSYHHTMTTRATPDTIRAAIDGAELREHGVRYRLHQAGETVMMTASSVPDGLRPAAVQKDPERAAGATERAMSLVTGSHHMQILWFETDRGRELGQFPFAYLIEDQAWVPRRMIFLQPPTRGLASEQGRWNDTCIHCHTTRGQPRPDPKHIFDTRVTELGVACEACHGPAARHLARFRSPVDRYREHLRKESGSTDIVHPGKLDAQRASQICSQCHALWQFSREQHAAFSRQGMSYRPGDDPDEHMWLMAPSRAEEDARVQAVMRAAPAYVEGQYWSDGQARVSGREYNGMIDSPCFAGGQLSCMSCHRMHQAHDDPRPRDVWANDQLEVKMDTDRACLQCHALGDELSAHTHHAPESSGSRCYNCHMPHTSYGLLKAIRSHKITVPSATETRKTGRPNACNMCHLDRSLAWTARELGTRFGVLEPQRTDAPEEQVPLVIAHALRGDAGQRALSAWALGWDVARAASSNSWAPAFLGVLLDDPYDAVRYIAQRSLRRYPGHADLAFDFTRSPSTRPPMAPVIATRAAAQLKTLPPHVPLDSRGHLDATAEGLLSRRDQRPINLLE